LHGGGSVEDTSNSRRSQIKEKKAPARSAGGGAERAISIASDNLGVEMFMVGRYVRCYGEYVVMFLAEEKRVGGNSPFLMSWRRGEYFDSKGTIVENEKNPRFWDYKKKKMVGQGLMEDSAARTTYYRNQKVHTLGRREWEKVASRRTGQTNSDEPEGPRPSY